MMLGMNEAIDQLGYQIVCVDMVMSCERRQYKGRKAGKEMEEVNGARKHNG